MTEDVVPQLLGLAVYHSLRYDSVVLFLISGKELSTRWPLFLIPT
jgi:hypothetical protein